jgi:CheY-like chemotaxis protein
VAITFQEDTLKGISPKVRVLYISETDMDIEIPGAEAYFQVGMSIQNMELSMTGAGACRVKGFVKMLSGSRCNLLFEKLEPDRPLLDYLQQRMSMEKVSQKTYKPAADIGKVLFDKYMEDQKTPKGPSKKKVLIVDDAISVHERFRAAFIENGFEVLQAVDGMDAIKKTLEAHPDIIIMDVNMPKMTGIEATRIIKSNPRTSNIPVCMFTTEGDQDFIVQALKIGVKDYIIKTSDAAAVVSRIRKIIGG